jgi:hypothetical protein
MGANAVTTVPVYVAGEVLTAADLNITNSGIPVFASTVERDAAFGGTGEKTLAEGQFAYLETGNVTQYYDGAAWQSVGVSPGLVLVKTQTIGSAVASVTITDSFSATYDAYKVVISGGSGTGAPQLNLTFGATTTGYYYGVIYNNFSTSVGAVGGSNVASMNLFGTATANGIAFNADIVNPFLAKETQVVSQVWYDATNTGQARGYVSGTTSYTAFTLTCSTGTLTGGTIRIYGYANS